MGTTTLHVVATRPHGDRIVNLCKNDGIANAIELMTIEDILESYSPATQKFLKNYMQSREYKREVLLEKIYRIYSTAGLPDAPLKRISNRRGLQRKNSK